MQAQTVTIVGMGRVGVSIARALRAADVGLTIVGHDRMRALAAVSYTHLRAHETVLDLVCRLLLEKKNKQKDNAAITSLTIPTRKN